MTAAGVTVVCYSLRLPFDLPINDQHYYVIVEIKKWLYIVQIRLIGDDLAVASGYGWSEMEVAALMDKTKATM